MTRVTKVIIFVYASFVFMVVQGCSGITVSQDYDQGYDFSGLNTFAWKPNADKEYGLRNNALVDKRIRAAVVNNLLAKNFVHTDAGKPDFYISYNITIEQKIATSSARTDVGVGIYGGRSYSDVGYVTGSEVYTYDLGTLLVDVTDVATDNLVWRGISTQLVSRHSNPEESTQRINETVGKMLAQFPPH